MSSIILIARFPTSIDLIELNGFRWFGDNVQTMELPRICMVIVVLVYDFNGLQSTGTCSVVDGNKMTSIVSIRSSIAFHGAPMVLNSNLVEFKQPLNRF